VPVFLVTLDEKRQGRNRDGIERERDFGRIGSSAPTATTKCAGGLRTMRFREFVRSVQWPPSTHLPNSIPPHNVMLARACRWDVRAQPAFSRLIKCLCRQ
jgi:hypothetical protein